MRYIGQYGGGGGELGYTVGLGVAVGFSEEEPIRGISGAPIIGLGETTAGAARSGAATNGEVVNKIEKASPTHKTLSTTFIEPPMKEPATLALNRL